MTGHDGGRCQLVGLREGKLDHFVEWSTATYRRHIALPPSFNLPPESLRLVVLFPREPTSDS